MPEGRTVAKGIGARSTEAHFAMIPNIDIQRSTFDRSCSLKTAFDSGYLIPIFCDEALPGDTFTLKTNSFGRMATPIFPVMDNIYMDFFYFAVPMRLLWDNWAKFCGERDNPDDTIDYEVPIIREEVQPSSLSDYLGIPLAVVAGTEHEFAAFWHRAYNLVYKEWFRDQNLIDSPPINKGDGPDDPTDYVLLRRAKKHDYFTSCLPFPQKGDPVLLPLGTSAPVRGLGLIDTNIQAPAANTVVRETGQLDPNTTTYPFGLAVDSGGGNVFYSRMTTGVAGTAYPDIYADLSDATAATINQIREAFQIQKFLERDMRAGTRLVEIIKSHFNVDSPDARMQRPEYIGGGSTMLNVHPIARTTPEGVASAEAPPFASLGAFATANVNGVGFHKSFTEHCVILGLVNVRADITYQQGINRMFNRRSRFDYYWPEFAHLGEQEVLNKEIYALGHASGIDPQDDATFGYQERYAEYRYKPSSTTGLMRSTAPSALDAWHLGLEFSGLPELNQTFIEDQPPFTRVLAVSAPQSQFFGDFYFELRCARPMPTYSVPGLVDHF